MKIGTINENNKKIPVVLSKKEQIKKIPNFSNPDNIFSILELIIKVSEDRNILSKIEKEMSGFDEVTETNIDWVPP